MERYELQQLLADYEAIGHIWNKETDAETIAAIKKLMKAEYLESGVAAWDKILGGFEKGVCQLVAAPTGTGKTKILTALAKAAVAKGYKVLFVGNNEEPMEFIIDNIISYNIPFMKKTEKTWEHIDFYMRDHEVDIVFYDYLGAGLDFAGDSAYTKFMKETENICKNAQVHNYALVTATQAKDELIMKDLKTRDYPCPLYQNSFLEMSRYITNYVKGAVYLQHYKPENSDEYLTYLIPLKRSYGERINSKIEINLNYQEAKFEEDFAFGGKK